MSLRLFVLFKNCFYLLVVQEIYRIHNQVLFGVVYRLVVPLFSAEGVHCFFKTSSFEHNSFKLWWYIGWKSNCTSAKRLIYSQCCSLLRNENLKCWSFKLILFAVPTEISWKYFLLSFNSVLDFEEFFFYWIQTNIGNDLHHDFPRVFCISAMKCMNDSFAFLNTGTESIESSQSIDEIEGVGTRAICQTASGPYFKIHADHYSFTGRDS